MSTPDFVWRARFANDPGIPVVEGKGFFHPFI
jgi:hypothetical protein